MDVFGFVVNGTVTLGLIGLVAVCVVDAVGGLLVDLREH